MTGWFYNSYKVTIVTDREEYERFRMCRPRNNKSDRRCNKKKMLRLLDQLDHSESQNPVQETLESILMALGRKCRNLKWFYT